MEKKEIVKREESIYQGKIIQVKKKTVELYDGKVSYREIVEHNGGVGILALTDKQEIILVKQFRTAINDFLYEIPAGKLETDEDPLICARRELREETGFDTKQISCLGKFYPSPGYTTEIIYLYYASELFVHPLQADDDENIEIFFLPITEIDDFLASNEIIDAKTILALLIMQKKRKLQ